MRRGDLGNKFFCLQSLDANSVKSMLLLRHFLQSAVKLIEHEILNLLVESLEPLIAQFEFNCFVLKLQK